MDHHLACQRCGERFDPGESPVGCPACRDAGESGRLEVVLEPASVMTVAAVEHPHECGEVDAGETVVCLGTGAGPKLPEKVTALIGKPPAGEPSVDSIAVTLGIDPEAPSTSFASATGA